MTNSQQASNVGEALQLIKNVAIHDFVNLNAGQTMQASMWLVMLQRICRQICQT